MRRPTVHLFPLALLLISATASAATVYKWVDEKGVTHYSDQPHEAAQKLEVADAPPVGSVSSTGAARSGNSPGAEAGLKYTRCELYRPETDEVFLNTDTVTAKLRLEPTLVPGDVVAIALDGKRVANQPSVTSEFVLSDIDRGTHSVMVVVSDRSGKPVCTTAAVTFHVRQPSTQAPVKAVRPRF